MTRPLALLVCAACGSGSDDSVRVTVTALNGHVEGWPVYFQDVDSAVVKSAVTSSNGAVSATMAAGGFVTVIPPADMINNAGVVYTFADVAPGDQLHVGPVFLQQQTATVGLTFGPDPANGVVGYDLATNCGVRAGFANAPTVPIELDMCTGVVDFLVLDHDSSGALVDQLSESVAVANGKGVTLTNPFVPVASATYAFSNLPDGPQVSVTRTIATARGTLWQAPQLTLADGQLSAIAQLPTVAAGTYVVRTDINGVRNQMVRIQTFIDWGPSTTSFSLDYASAGLREYTTQPSLDDASNAIVWTEDPTGVLANVVLAGRVDSRNGATPASWTWFVAAPRSDATTVTFPVLPTDVFDYNPEPGDFTGVSMLRNAVVPGGYDAFRPVAFENSSFDFAQLVSGTSDQIVFMDQ